MRIERLFLERFGHFEGLDFDFGASPRLHVVFGPNEAGKSTVLAAISDLLFGMPAQTPYNFLHSYGTLRIGARIVSDAGRTLEFKRRKAKTHAGTLLTLGEVERALPDDALATFLGGADKALFERMFGLDHQRLRQAGDRMIQSDGDLGQAIFEAGSGIDSLNQVLGGLGAEIDVLGSPGQKASRKPLWRSAEDYATAQRDRRVDTLKVDVVRVAEQKVLAAVKERKRISSELAEVRQRRARIERVRRVGPIVADIDRLLGEIASMEDVPELPASFEGEWAELAKAVATEAHATETTEARAEQAKADLDDRPVAADYAPHEAFVGEVREGLGRYRKDVADELKLSRDIAILEDGIGTRLRALGHDPDQVFQRGDPRDLMPTAAEMVRARGAIQSAVAAATRREELSWVLAGAVSELDEAVRATAASGGVVDPAQAATLVEEALGAGDVETAAVAARLADDGARRAAVEAVARLPGWGKGLDALASCPFPDAAALAGFDTRIDDAVTKRDEARARISQGEQALVDVQARLVQLQAGSEVPTVEAIAAGREKRDSHWRAIRDAYLGAGRYGEPVAAPDASARAADFEGAVRKADDLVDRREAEAQRVAVAVELKATETALRGRLDLDREALDGREAEVHRAMDDWADLWSSTGVAPGTPAAMTSWSHVKDETLRLLTAAREASERREHTEGIAEQTRALWARAAVLLEVADDGHAAASVRSAHVRVALAERRDRWSHARTAAADIARCSLKRDEAALSLAELAKADVARLEEWGALAERLGWRGAATVAEAEAVLQNWEGMTTPLSERETARRRLVGLREDNRAFRARVAELEANLVRIVGPHADDVARTPEAVVRRFEDGLAIEKAAQTRNEEARRVAETAVLRLEQTRALSAQADAAASAFRRRHGLGPDDDCVAIGQKATAARLLRTTLTQRRVDLMNAGEGLGEPILREEAVSMSPETVVSEVAALADQEDALVEAGQIAAQEATSADAALSQVTSRTGGVDARAREQAAALAFAGHAERWLVLAAAQGIMARSVERYRAQNQHPMIARAGELMAGLTSLHANPIEQLSAEYRDKKKLSLVGIRRDGTPCEIAHMTEGTLDQLFLGLRIAAVERYAAARETLPFVADDLFITSDDERTECGLQALAALAKTTQVILFTHHRSVLRSAEGMATSHGVACHLLPVSSASARAAVVAG